MNPLLPLITNLLTRNREYVVLIGAGFSKDAGIPSGWDILIDSLKPLYIEDKKIQNPDEIIYEEIERWYVNHPEYSKLSYSSILELIYIGEIERRQHLIKYFENKQPGESHRLLAQLVKNGFIRFIFTTNLDDLVEKALAEYGVSYDVIFSDDILNGSVSWDKVKECRVYKLHGDYKTGKVKNTIAELSTLDKTLSEDFQYIIDRHGLIVIGYAGRDEGLMNHILKRSSNNYPIYWQYVDFPVNNDEYKFFYQLVQKSEENSKGLINFIQNSSASKLLANLITGIETIDSLTISEEKNKETYKNYILNQNDKKIRALTLSTIDEFKDIYISFKNAADDERDYSAKYKLFDELNKNITFIYDYADVLLTYQQLNEMNFFLNEILKITTSYRWKDSYDFIEPTQTYLIITILGAILLRHNCIDIIRGMYSLVRKSIEGYSNLLNRLNLHSNGWQAIIASSEFRGSWAPKFQIICSKHIPPQISVQEFIRFDAFLTMDIALNSVGIRWFCYSRCNYEIFQEVFFSIFENLITSVKIADAFITNLKLQPQEVPCYPDGIDEVINRIVTVTKKKYEIKEIKIDVKK